MAGREPKYPAQITQDEHENDTAPFTKRVLLYGWDPVGLQKVRLKVDSDGVLDTSGTGGGGSGTEYTEGATDSTITGTAIMWEDTSDTLRAVSTSKPLPVAIISGAGSGGTAAADDADFTAGTTSGTPAMGVYESSPSSVTNGGLGTVGITSTREMKVYDARLATAINSNRVDVNLASSGITLSTSAIAQGTIDHDSADSTPPVKIGGYAKATAPTAVSADGDRVNAWYDLNGRAAIFDGGGSLTVDGTVTAELSATDNAVLDQIELNQDSQTAILTTIDADTGGMLTALQLIDNAISGNEMQVDVVAALPAGNNNIGDVDAIQSGTWTVQPGNTANTTPWLTSPRPATSGGLDIFRSIDLDETEEEVKATAGQLFSLSAFNRTAAPLYLKFYNATAANVTVGTTTPVLTFVIPANADSDGAGFIWNNEHGLAFSTAITAAATTGIADNDTGAPGANDCIVNIGYK